MLLWLYLELIALAEILIILGAPRAGVTLYAVLLVALLTRGGLSRRSDEHRVTIALALVPLGRVLALTLPLASLPRLAWYALVIAPLLLAAWLVVRQIEIARADLGLNGRDSLLQIMLAGGGLSMGIIQFTLVGTEPLIDAFAWNGLLLGVIVTAIVSGLGEELIYRGILQTTTGRVIGGWAVLYTALLTTVLQLSYRSPSGLAFALGTGLFLAAGAYFSRSIVGVMLAHALANLTVFVVMPWLNQLASAQQIATLRVVAIATGILAVAALVVLTVRSFSSTPTTVQASPIGRQLRALRREAGLMYTDLALRTGVSARLLAEIEYGLAPMDAEVQRRIAQVLAIVPAQVGRR